MTIFISFTCRLKILFALNCSYSLLRHFATLFTDRHNFSKQIIAIGRPPHSIKLSAVTYRFSKKPLK